MRTKLLPLLTIICAMVFLHSGCIKIYEEIRLKSDLSGTISMQVNYDLEAFAEVAIVFTQMMGNMGDKNAKMPQFPPEQMEAMKAMMLQQMKENIKQEMPDQQQLKQQLGEGLHLEQMNIEDNDNAVNINFKIAFDHISKLKGMKNFNIGQKDTQKPKKNMPKFGGFDLESTTKGFDKPFEAFKIEEQGEFLIIQQSLGKEGGHKGPMSTENLPPQMQGLMKKFEKMGMFVRIRVPYMRYKIVEQNADKYDEQNHTLYWFYTFEKMQQWSKQNKKPPVLSVKMQKISK